MFATIAMRKPAFVLVEILKIDVCESEYECTTVPGGSFSRKRVLARLE